MAFTGVARVWSDMARWFLATLLFDIGWHGVLLPVFWLSDPVGNARGVLGTLIVRGEYIIGTRCIRPGWEEFDPFLAFFCCVFFIFILGVCICGYVEMFVNVCLCLPVFIGVFIGVFVGVFVGVFIGVFIGVCLCLCTFVLMCICMCLCVFTGRFYFLPLLSHWVSRDVVSD